MLSDYIVVRDGTHYLYIEKVGKEFFVYLFKLAFKFYIIVQIIIGIVILMEIVHYFIAKKKEKK